MAAPAAVVGGRPRASSRTRPLVAGLVIACLLLGGASLSSVSGMDLQFTISLETGSPVAFGLNDEGTLVSQAIANKYACNSMAGPACSLTNDQAPPSTPGVLGELLRQVLAQTVRATAASTPGTTPTRTAAPIPSPSSAPTTPAKTAATTPPTSASPAPTTSATTSQPPVDGTIATDPPRPEGTTADSNLLSASDLRRILRERFGDVEFVGPDGETVELDSADLDTFTLDTNGNIDPADVHLLQQFLDLEASDSEGTVFFDEITEEDQAAEEERRHAH